MNQLNYEHDDGNHEQKMNQSAAKVATFFGEGVRNAAIAAAEIKPSDIVADVGVGTGFLAEGALVAGARVIGIDSSEGSRFSVSKLRDPGEENSSPSATL